MSGRVPSRVATEISGHRILFVDSRGPGAKAGLVPFLDVITHVDEEQTDDMDRSLVALIIPKIGDDVLLSVYNVKTRASRNVVIYPNRNWGGQGVLGIVARYDVLDHYDRRFLVMDVQPNGPAEDAGLRPVEDYILGGERFTARNEGDLSLLLHPDQISPEEAREMSCKESVEGSTNDQLEEQQQPKKDKADAILIYVYNSPTDTVRVVALIPSKEEIPPPEGWSKPQGRRTAMHPSEQPAGNSPAAGSVSSTGGDTQPPDDNHSQASQPHGAADESNPADTSADVPPFEEEVQEPIESHPEADDGESAHHEEAAEEEERHTEEETAPSHAVDEDPATAPAPTDGKKTKRLPAFWTGKRKAADAQSPASSQAARTSMGARVSAASKGVISNITTSLRQMKPRDALSAVASSLNSLAESATKIGKDVTPTLVRLSGPKVGRATAASHKPPAGHWFEYLGVRVQVVASLPHTTTRGRWISAEDTVILDKAAHERLDALGVGDLFARLTSGSARRPPPQQTADSQRDGEDSEEASPDKDKGAHAETTASDGSQDSSGDEEAAARKRRQKEKERKGRKKAISSEDDDQDDDDDVALARAKARQTTKLKTRGQLKRASEQAARSKAKTLGMMVTEEVPSYKRDQHKARKSSVEASSETRSRKPSHGQSSVDKHPDERHAAVSEETPPAGAVVVPPVTAGPRPPRPPTKPKKPKPSSFEGVTTSSSSAEGSAEPEGKLKGPASLLQAEPKPSGVGVPEASKRTGSKPSPAGSVRSKPGTPSPHGSLGVGGLAPATRNSPMAALSSSLSKMAASASPILNFLSGVSEKDPKDATAWDGTAQGKPEDRDALPASGSGSQPASEANSRRASATDREFTQSNPLMV